MSVAQQAQHAKPCLHPMPKLVSLPEYEIAQPDVERQRSKRIIFQRVN